jgi:HEPN domain-containing protein
MSAVNSPLNWYRLAQMDFDTAHYIFDNMRPKPLEISCYLAQQSAEKLLKGFLTGKGQLPPKTHNLVLLNDICVEINVSFERLDDALADLNLFGVQPKYPNEIEITEEDTKIALKNIDSIMLFFREHIF